MDYVIAVVPSIMVALLFVLLVQIFFNADRRERKSQARIDAAVDSAVAQALEKSKDKPKANS